MLRQFNYEPTTRRYAAYTSIFRQRHARKLGALSLIRFDKPATYFARSLHFFYRLLSIIIDCLRKKKTPMLDIILPISPCGRRQCSTGAGTNTISRARHHFHHY